MDASAFLDRYMAALYRQQITPHCYDANRRWTPLATSALVEATGLQHRGDVEVATRGCPDREGQCEYLTLDILIWTKSNKWGPPLFIAEHESTTNPDDVRYSAWKLLTVEAGSRVLVSYYGPMQAFGTFDELRSAVQDVCDANPDRCLLLIGANSAEVDRIEELRAQHRAEVLGRCVDDPR